MACGSVLVCDESRPKEDLYAVNRKSARVSQNGGKTNDVSRAISNRGDETTELKTKTTSHKMKTDRQRTSPAMMAETVYCPRGMEGGGPTKIETDMKPLATHFHLYTGRW
jgi:hypothetical protein